MEPDVYKCLHQTTTTISLPRGESRHPGTDDRTVAAAPELKQILMPTRLHRLQEPATPEVDQLPTEFGEDVLEDIEIFGTYGSGESEIRCRARSPQHRTSDGGAMHFPDIVEQE